MGIRLEGMRSENRTPGSTNCQVIARAAWNMISMLDVAEVLAHAVGQIDAVVGGQC
jgi:hypothetical protein